MEPICISRRDLYVRTWWRPICRGMRERIVVIYIFSHCIRWIRLPTFNVTHSTNYWLHGMVIYKCHSTIFNCTRRRFCNSLNGKSESVWQRQMVILKFQSWRAKNSHIFNSARKNKRTTKLERRKENSVIFHFEVIKFKTKKKMGTNWWKAKNSLQNRTHFLMLFYSALLCIVKIVMAQIFVTQHFVNSNMFFIRWIARFFVCAHSANVNSCMSRRVSIPCHVFKRNDRQIIQTA